MAQQHPMGVMADPEELLRALTALGAIRMPTVREQEQAQRAAGGPELWRLQCAHHLAGVVECQVLMAAGAVPAVKENATPLLLAGWELFTGAGTAEDAARVGLLLAIATVVTFAPDGVSRSSGFLVSRPFPVSVSTASSLV